MAESNANIAELIRRYATTLVLNGADRFKVRAYRRAAESIETLDTDIAALVARNEDLTRIPGVGKVISRTIDEVVRTGRFTLLDEALSKLQPEVLEIAARPSLDPKKVLQAYKKLKINSLDELRSRLESGEVRDKLGARLEYHIRRGLDDRPRMLLYEAEPLALRIEAYLTKIPGVTRVSRAGSLRRKMDTVGKLNFVVAAKRATLLFKAFAQYGSVTSAVRRGKNESSFQLSKGITVTLTWTRPEEWGWHLLLQTGSAAHVEDLRARAVRRKIDLSSGGLSKRKIDASDEEKIYQSLGLEYIEPELREGRGEVKAAASRKLPSLVTLADLKGDLHMHTTASDGANTIREMAKAARERGYQYIAITDHSQWLKITNGLSEKRLLQQIRDIEKVNARLKDIVVLKSAEVDILEDGRLDYSNGVLKELDLTICSIHSRFALNKEQQTERILRAMDNPHFNILGHATGRLLLKREGYELDIERIIEHAKQAGCFFEINSSPDRLDLSEEHAKLAKDHGIKIAVNTDAHSIDELGFISAGINQARRAWLAPRDVLNTVSLTKLRKLLKR
jgi:DNA polymerase (family 10)